MATLGKEVRTGQDIIAGMGNKADRVKAEFLMQIEQRQIPGLKVSESNIGGFTSLRSYTLIQKSVGAGATATSAVRIEPYGVDLVVERRHFEMSGFGTGANVGKLFYAIAVIGAGLLTLAFTLAGVILIIIGILLLPHGITAEFSGTQRQDSFLLKDAVQMSLTKAIKIAHAG